MLQTLYRWYGKRTVYAVAALVVVLLVVGLIINAQRKTTEEAPTDSLPTVNVAAAGQLANTQSVTLIGTVRALSEAQIQSEVAGRVVSVPVTLGSTVQAGATIAVLENAAQRAAVVQAQGAYEAALAAANQTDLSVDQARTSLTSAQNSALITVTSAAATADSVLAGSVDTLFTNPTGSIVGLRIDDFGQAVALTTARKNYQQTLSVWKSQTATLTTSSNLDEALASARTNIATLITLVDNLATLTQRQSVNTTLDGVAMSTYTTTLLSSKSTLTSTLTALNTAETSLAAAREALTKAEAAGTSTTISAANAQVKQALGALLAAQAQLNKTILRSPITGTINSLNVNVGDFLGAFTQVAEVANNNALEISTFVGENDLALLTIGQTVTLDDRYTGTITQIAAGIDTVTKKTEIKIATETDGLTNGDTVRINITNTSTPNTPTGPLLVPLTAVKFAAEDGVVFTVVDGVLVAMPVTLGAVRGTYVEITSGITDTTSIVVDARGWTAGAKVEAVTQ